MVKELREREREWERERWRKRKQRLYSTHFVFETCIETRNYVIVLIITRLEHYPLSVHIIGFAGQRYLWSMVRHRHEPEWQQNRTEHGKRMWERADRKARSHREHIYDNIGKFVADIINRVWVYKLDKTNLAKTNSGEWRRGGGKRLKRPNWIVNINLWRYSGHRKMHSRVDGFIAWGQDPFGFQ